jgi:hypothetical protein
MTTLDPSNNKMGSNPSQSTCMYPYFQALYCDVLIPCKSAPVKCLKRFIILKIISELEEAKSYL